jgi:hypothetical protein
MLIMLVFSSGAYWEGGILPHIGQFGSTLISLYNPEILATVALGVNMTHAHLRVDEVHIFNGTVSWDIVYFFY